MVRGKRKFEWLDQVADGVETVRAIDAFVRRWGNQWFAGLRDGNDPTHVFYNHRTDTLQGALTYLQGLGLAGSADRLGSLARG